LRSLIPGGTFVLSSGGMKVSRESSELRGGIFTHYLLRGLSGDASFSRDGSIRVSELVAFVTRSVKEFTGGSQAPMFAASAAIGDPIILGPGRGIFKDRCYRSRQLRLQ
jgi:hypothetical protein